MPSFETVISEQNDVVTSPDGNMKARVKAGVIQQVEFRPGAYERYADHDLARQLEFFSKLVAVNRRRARRKALMTAMETTQPPQPREPKSTKQHELVARQQELDIRVDTGNIRVRITDEHTWQISIRPGTTKRVSEVAFVQEMSQASKFCLSQLRARTHHIRHEVFGPSTILKGLAGTQRPR